MALMIGQDSTQAVISKQYGRLEVVNSDEEITKGTISELAEILLRNNPRGEIPDVIRDMRAYPLTSERCVKAIAIIATIPVLVVVPNEINQVKQDGRTVTKFVWERIIASHDVTTIAALDENKIAALRAQDLSVTPVVTISKNAFKAMTRHAKVLAEKEEQNRIRRVTESTRLISTPRVQQRRQNKGCCTLV